MDLASAIEHTKLGAAVRPSDVEALCDEATEFGFAGVCVNPVYVATCAARLAVSKIRVVSVIGFPLGASSEDADVAETRYCVAHGVDELDMVIPVAAALDGRLQEVTRRVEAIVAHAPSKVVKAILETGYFEPGQLREVARAALAGGAHYLKTCTGFGPGSATVSQVRLLTEVAGGQALVKASGGIRDTAGAMGMLTAGASRIGTSSGVAIIRGLSEQR